MPRKHPDRAPYGSLDERFVLALPGELRAEARKLAEREGVSESEWWRRAGRDRVLRQSSRTLRGE